MNSVRLRRGVGAGVLSLAVFCGTALPVPAGAVPLPVAGAYLDLPAVGAAAETNGGFHPDLPTDPDALRPALDAARAAGIPPTRYRTLLQQYWLAIAVRNAGMDLNAWDPERGLVANEGNLEKTFAYYTRLQLDHPDFLWTGQGGLAGPSFAAGIMDVDLARVVLDVRAARELVAAITGAVGAAAGPVAARLPADVQALLAVGPLITAADIDWFQRRVIAMSKHIFIDLIPQHEAYLAGGLPAIDEFAAAGAIDERDRRAWHGIATGDPQRVFEGNRDLLRREQLQIIRDQWNRASGHRGAVGRALTYLSTVAADPAIPGVRAPREVAPLLIAVDDRGLYPSGGPGCVMQTPLPDFNWADAESRWRYIVDEMLPAYRRLTVEDAGLWRRTLAEPTSARIAGQRAFARLPQLLGSVARTTQIRC